MLIAESVSQLRLLRRQLDGSVGLVPTMGALHEGHLRLVDEARSDNDSTVVTIFLNPTQFGPEEDLARYPRDLDRDLDLLRQRGVSLVFVPTPEMMYPSGFQTWIEVDTVSCGLEGERRPGHFRGVATVVCKLFNLIQPNRAYFGQKDAQQVVVIKQMVRDLNFPLEVVVCPTVREADGLAMSSRNAYLGPTERAAASAIYRGLRAAADRFDSGEITPDVLKQIVIDVVSMQPGLAIEYVALSDARDLRELSEGVEAPALLSVVARAGTTRLLDNTMLPVTLNNRADLTQQLGV